MERVAKFQVGEQVIVFLRVEDFYRASPLGVVEAVEWFINAAVEPPVTYAVYTVRMDDGLNPNPIRSRLRSAM